MSRAKRWIQWCVIGLLVLSPDLFSASGFVSSDGVFGCSSDNDFDFDEDDEETFSFDFSDGTQGWQGGFADYPQGQEVFYELSFDYRPLLPDLDPNQRGLFISGNNHSDDLFMFVKRRIDGLEPNETYLVDLEVEIGSEAGSNCVGIGGSPAIALKAGATQIEPLAIADFSGFLRMNIDKGNQSLGGEDAQVLGDIGVNVDCIDPVFESKRLETPTDDPFVVIADENGAAWLIVGTDSSFEGTTRLFYTEVEARFSPR
jgi:hypothetical protein